MSVNIGKNIRDFREFLDISPAELAQKIGSGWYEHKIIEIESKDEVNFEDLTVIAKALQVSPEVLQTSTESKMKFYFLGALLVPIVVFIIVLVTAISIKSSLVLKEGTIKTFTNKRIGKGEYINGFSLTNNKSAFIRQYGGAFFDKHYFGIDRILFPNVAVQNQENPNLYEFKNDDYRPTDLTVRFYIRKNDVDKFQKDNVEIPFFHLKFKQDEAMQSNVLMDVIFYVFQEQMPGFVPYVCMLLSGFLIFYGVSEPIRKKLYFSKPPFSKVQEQLVYGGCVLLYMLLLFCGS